MERIAETSYIKWIEFWLLLGTFIPFVQVILITVIEWLRNKEEMEALLRMKKNLQDSWEESERREAFLEKAPHTTHTPSSAKRIKTAKNDKKE